MQTTDSVSLVALLLTGLMVTASVGSLRATQAIAAPLGSGLTLAALAPSQETEQQREARLIEGARKEGKVVVWDGGNAKEWEHPHNKFRQKYPFLVVELWRTGDDEMYQKMTSEARARVYNVDFASGDINFVSELKKAGLMKKYNWPNAAAWSPQYKDSEGYWVSRDMNAAVIAYNTNLVSAAEAPKNWDDLLDPKWKGAISIGKDSGDWVLMLWAAWGKEKTVNYLKKLAENNIVLGAGATSRTELLAAGAFKIDLRLNLNRILDFQKKGAPIDWVRTDPILSKATPKFIAEHAPHPNAAILYADWSTSLEGLQALVDANGKRAADPRVKNKQAEVLKGLRIVLFPVEFAVHGNEANRIFFDTFLK